MRDYTTILRLLLMNSIYVYLYTIYVPLMISIYVPLMHADTIFIDPLSSKFKPFVTHDAQ